MWVCNHKPEVSTGHIYRGRSEIKGARKHHTQVNNFWNEMA